MQDAGRAYNAALSLVSLPLQLPLLLDASPDTASVRPHACLLRVLLRDRLGRIVVRNAACRRE